MITHCIRYKEAQICCLFQIVQLNVKVYIPVERCKFIFSNAVFEKKNVWENIQHDRRHLYLFKIIRIRNCNICNHVNISNLSCTNLFTNPMTNIYNIPPKSHGILFSSLDYIGVKKINSTTFHHYLGIIL